MNIPHLNNFTGPLFSILLLNLYFNVLSKYFSVYVNKKNEKHPAVMIALKWKLIRFCWAFVSAEGNFVENLLICRVSYVKRRFKRRAFYVSSKLFNDNGNVAFN